MEDQLTGAVESGTIVHPLALIVVAGAIVLMFVLPRKYLFAPLFVTAFFIPLEQRVVIGGLHFMMFRIVLVFAWIRLLLGGGSSGREPHPWRLNSTDKAMILWGLSSLVSYCLLWGSWEAFINRSGLLYNAFGIYFFLRILYKDSEDVDRTTKIFAVLSALVAICMVNEQITGRNPFALFGGVPEITPIREGRLRAQAAFMHPILAGTFGATLLPLFIGLWRQGRKARATAAVGIVSATVITITAMSSTPLLAYLAGIVGLAMWPFRRRMRAIRWGIVLSLVSLHLIMKAPVWALINRISVVGGSASWHRYELVDQFIRRFGEWWLLGTTANAQWGLDTWDTANQYVNIGVRGGLLTLILFLVIISRSFRSLGLARKAAEGNHRVEFRFWALGAALFSHVVAFIGVAYFDQTIAAWYALLAMITAATIPAATSMETQLQRQTNSRMPRLRLASGPQSVPLRTGPCRALSTSMIFS